jgi:hypothetical protein
MLPAQKGWGGSESELDWEDGFEVPTYLTTAILAGFCGQAAMTKSQVGMESRAWLEHLMPS